MEISIEEELARMAAEVQKTVQDQADETEISLSVRNKPIEDWPEFQIKWDESIENLIRSHDGISQENFESKYSSGILIANVNMEEFDQKLFYNDFQTVSEFWDVGSPSKKSDAIAYWMLGGAMTPCFIKVHDTNTIKIVGGMHRSSVARAKGQTTIPVLFSQVEQSELEKVICLTKIRNPKI